MAFSILHISDLHRDLSDEVENPWLLESLVRDFDRYGHQDPPILRPALCVVSGDLVYGVQTEHSIRVVDVPRRVLDALERHKADCPPIDGDYVFRMAEGN